ncbi:MAG: UbiA family prenyltransferase [Chloroflexi bacterium]|nr:UbiA family prenyltransferase [Chloroflexota bacterium]
MRYAPRNTQYAIRSTPYGLRRYLALIKSLQTALLLLTGLAGFVSAHGLTAWPAALAAAGSLFLAISGSTVLNMAYDRDIDGRMARTACRPLPSGQISLREVVLFGGTLAALGVGWALALAPLYAAVVFAGLFFDVVVYTVWLKRRTPYAILIGGLSGGMPVLAGRVLAVGQVDAVGVLLALGVLCWIPTHIMTLSMRCHGDYCAAGVPTFPAAYGFRATRAIIAVSALAAAAAMTAAAVLVCVPAASLRVLMALNAALVGLAVATLARPSDRLNFALFKFASLYMLGAMVIVAV